MPRPLDYAPLQPTKANDDLAAAALIMGMAVVVALLPLCLLLFLNFLGLL